MEKDSGPTILEREDFEKCIKKLFEDTRLKVKECVHCGKESFLNYGACLGECDECWFSRFPEEEVRKFYRSFLE